MGNNPSLSAKSGRSARKSPMATAARAGAQPDMKTASTAVPMSTEEPARARGQQRRNRNAPVRDVLDHFQYTG